MAKILAKFRSLNQKKIIKIRQHLDFYNAEVAALEEKYNEKLDKKLNVFLLKANKKLARLAFEACDKEEYAEDILEHKLQKYDVKAYMKQRKLQKVHDY
jgi:hypothetical protein